jgi:hypothetical protein
VIVILVMHGEFAKPSPVEVASTPPADSRKELQRAGAVAVVAPVGFSASLRNEIVEVVVAWWSGRHLG